MAQQVILSLIKEALFNKECVIENVDLDAVRKEADFQEISPFIYSVLKKKNLLSREFDSEWRKFLTPRLAKNNGVFLTHVEVASLFEKEKIPYTIIKGVASAKYYNEPLARIMGDTDVLVKEDFIEKATEVLLNNGYKLTGEETKYHISFKKKSSSVELHKWLNGIPDNKTEETKELLKDIFQKAEKYQTPYGDVYVPSAFHHGFIMLAHMYSHINTAGIGLRHLCDWAVFIEKIDENEFEEIFKERLKHIGLWRFAVKISQACLELGVSYKKWMGQIDKDFSEFFINDIFAGGNFGRKDDERRMKLVFAPNTIEERSAPITRYFKYGVASLKRIWPFFEKYKIFMPIGFVMYCFRILFRLIFGKSKVYDLKEGYRRRDIYEQLKWYEREN